MPTIDKSLGIQVDETRLNNIPYLWVMTMVERRLKIGVITTNTRSILLPLEIIGVTQRGKIAYICILKRAGYQSVRIKVALNKSRIKGLHRYIILWLVQQGITVFCDRALSPAGAIVWRKLLQEGIAVASSDENIWSNKSITIRVPNNKPLTFTYGVPECLMTSSTTPSLLKPDKQT